MQIPFFREITPFSTARIYVAQKIQSWFLRLVLILRKYGKYGHHVISKMHPWTLSQMHK